MEWEEERGINVKNFARSRNFVALGALAIMMAVSGPSQAAGMGGHGGGGGGGHGGGGGGQHGGGGGNFGGHEGGHFEGHEGGHFEGHEGRHFEEHGRFGFGFGFGPIYPYYPYYSTPGYWYYCPSYNGYYPNVTTCPEAWVTVPAQ